MRIGEAPKPGLEERVIEARATVQQQQGRLRNHRRALPDETDTLNIKEQACATNVNSHLGTIAPREIQPRAAVVEEGVLYESVSQTAKNARARSRFRWPDSVGRERGLGHSSAPRWLVGRSRWRAQRVADVMREVSSLPSDPRMGSHGLVDGSYSASSSIGGQAHTRLRSPKDWSMRLIGGQYLSPLIPAGYTPTMRSYERSHSPASS